MVDRRRRKTDSSETGPRKREPHARRPDADSAGAARSVGVSQRRRVCAIRVAAGLLVLGGVAAYVLIPRRASRESLNVLLISMDTTRADALGCYGNAQSRTPNIDALAAAGALFTQCTTVAPSTLPAHSSMLTGAYPFVHGARVNGQFKLQDDNVTLAETLKSAGLSTGAQVAAMVLNREFGLAQGFDEYFDPRAAQAQRKTPPSAGPVRERSATEVADGGIDFLRRNKDHRFLLFLHFFDPHKPLAPPKPFSAMPNPYLGEIAYVDQQLGRVLHELSALKLDRRTLVVLTADHGEGNHEHGEENHGLLVYDSTLSVPLVMRCPGWVPAGVRVARQARTLDVAATILDIVGVAAPPEVQGRSLAPLMRGDPGEADPPAYSETLASLCDYGYAPLRALRADGWKYILGPCPELYHVAVDPGELHDLIEAEAPRAARMRSALEQMIRTTPSGPSAMNGRRAVSPDDRRALQGLGYMGAESTAGFDPNADNDLDRYPPKGLNPIDHIAEIDYANESVSYMIAGRYDEAVRRLRAFLAEHPDRHEGMYMIHRCLANALEGGGHAAESIEFYEKAVAERPDDAITRTDMGIALMGLNRLDEAIAAFERALQSPLELPYTHLQLGTALDRKGDAEAAAKQFHAALAADPDIDAAHAGLAEAYEKLGRREEAIAEMRRAVELNPSNPGFQSRLKALSRQTP